LRRNESRGVARGKLAATVLPFTKIRKGGPECLRYAPRDLAPASLEKDGASFAPSAH
jgi:hypothetical protein